jgi:hypothetical protein
MVKVGDCGVGGDYPKHARPWAMRSSMCECTCVRNATVTYDPYALSRAVLWTKVTLLKSLPSCREMMAKFSGLRWAYSGNPSVMTVPPWPRRKVSVFEQPVQSQKYSVWL